MAILNKTGITNGGTIQAEHVTRTIDALTGGSTDTIIATGSFLGSFVANETVLFNSSLQQGDNTSAYGDYSHTEGTATVASGSASHAEGYGSQALGATAHAEGFGTQAVGAAAHSEGRESYAYGDYSHADGYLTEALGDYSYTHGLATVASGSGQHVIGTYNTHGDTTSLFVVGNGGGSPAIVRSDAFKVRMSGSIVLPTTQSAAPSWTGTNGEMVFATVGGVHRMYLYMAGAWRSASFA